MEVAESGSNLLGVRMRMEHGCDLLGVQMWVVLDRDFIVRMQVLPGCNQRVVQTQVVL